MAEVRAAVLAALALVAGLGGAFGHVAHSEHVAAPPVAARWSELTAAGGQLPPGAELTSVVSFDRRFVAAGAYFGSVPALPAALGCPIGCNPTVWTSSDGHRWSPVFAEPAMGGLAGESLVVTPVGLFLFNDDEGTAMWRSANGSSWERAQLPVGMEALGVAGAAWANGRLVAIFSNKYAGSADRAYGEADTIWSSPNGVTWRQDEVPGAPAFSSLTASSGEFLAGGTSRRTGKPEVWLSPNGLTWATFPLHAPAGTVVVASDDDHFVAEDITSAGTASARAQLWCSADGQSWARAAVQGGPIAPALLIYPGPSPVMATSVGLVTWGNPLSRLWWSAAGCAWYPVVSEGAPAPPHYQVQGLFPGRRGIVATAVATGARAGAEAGTTSVWEVELAPTTAGTVASKEGHKAATDALPKGAPLVDAAAFSHEGLLAFVSRGSLWVLDGATGSLREVWKAESPSSPLGAGGHAIDPVFSADGHWLGFFTIASQLQFQAGQLWLSHGDGSGARAVPGFTQVRQLSWSPEGDELAFLDPTKPGIWALEPGGTPRAIAGTAHAANYVWSPDGRSIAFSGYYRYGELEAVPVSGGAPVLWQPERNNPAYPLAFNPAIPAAWLPGHEGILYWVDTDNSASIEADGLALYLVESPGGPTHMLGHTLVNSSAVAVAPDGAIAIDSTTGMGRYQWLGKAVERCSAKTASCTNVPVPKTDVSIDPSWSPEGDELVFAIGPNYGYSAFPQSTVQAWYSKLSLWRVASNGAKPVPVQGSGGAANSLWSPSGKSLLFEAKDGLWLKLGSGGAVEVASPLFGKIWPNYYAQVDWTSQFAWSPT